MAEGDEYGDERTDVHEHVEQHIGRDVLGKPEQLLKYDEMAGAGDGQKFAQPLYKPEKDRFQIIHRDSLRIEFVNGQPAGGGHKAIMK